MDWLSTDNCLLYPPTPLADNKPITGQKIIDDLSIGFLILKSNDNSGDSARSNQWIKNEPLSHVVHGYSSFPRGFR